MDWGSLTEDQLDRIIAQSEQEIAGWRVAEMAAIREKRSRPSHGADGYRSIVDWVAARADISHQTSRSLCWTASRLDEAPEIVAQLEAGEITFDRAEQLARLPKGKREGHESYDISQLRRLVAHYRRLTPRREQKNASFLNFQPSLDETTTSIWGEMAGLDARVVEKAVDQRADEVLGSDLPLSVTERRALALVAICQDSLYGTESPEGSPSVEVVVTVDARTAVADGGETGVAVLAGPRIGPRALHEVFCNGMVSVVAITEDGTPLSVGRRSRSVPRRLRRFVLDRDMGCTVEGWSSRYRLEVHHCKRWPHGCRQPGDPVLVSSSRSSASRRDGAGADRAVPGQVETT